ncbi:MAG: Methyltransferase, family [Bacteriovoracaceae bacterium]|nr:Methyltransferase, family [Bacteriovoracaceae bacterium]
MNAANESNFFKEIQQLSPWFHNLHFDDGIQTAPDHFLGDFPTKKWQQIQNVIPTDLNGWNCLDIGCNAGFYSFELAKRGARVLGIDSEPHYLNQARWASKIYNLKNPPIFRLMQIHDLAHLNESFDLILFMGVFYHLRYPLLALDTIAPKVKAFMIFQTLTTTNKNDEPASFEPRDNYSFEERSILNTPGWPTMAFIEKSFSDDSTNWWVPSHSAVLALLRSTGFSSIVRLAHEIYICRPPKKGIAKNRIWSDAEWKSATRTKVKGEIT